MTIEEIIRGESKNTEFKEKLPKKSEKYTKTVVAYANTQGGKLVFGVVDETREVVGIDEAMKFVLRNIRLGAKVHGLLISESYELPVESIREMIVNAHCHRNMTDESCVQVAIYDDRLEVTSPGGLYNGLTFEDMMQGYSRLRMAGRSMYLRWDR